MTRDPQGPETPREQLRTPIHVFHMIDSGGIYGAERMVLSLLPSLSERGISVSLGCFGNEHAEEGAVGRAAAELGVDTHYFRFGAGLSARGLLRIRHVLQLHRPDLLHLHGYKATIVGGMLGAAARIRRVATYHAEARWARGLSKQVAVETRILRRLESVAAVSGAIATELEERGVSPARIRIIPNGIPPFDLPKRVHDDHFTMAVVGRLVPGKNVHVALAALAALLPRWPRLRMIVAGEGPLRSALEEKTKELGLSERVSFPGFVKDVPALLARSDALVMPSQTEGMPIALIEAMAAGLPIVASAVGSIPDVVRHREEALLVPPGDELELRRAIEHLLLYPDKAALMASKGLTRFRHHFTSDSMAEAYATLYAAVVGRPELTAHFASNSYDSSV